VIKYFKIALRNVLLNKKRSLFIIMAVAIGTIIILLTLSLSNGVRENMIKNSLATTAGHINVYGIQEIRGRSLQIIEDFDNINKIVEDAVGEDKVSLRYHITYNGDVYAPQKSIKSKRAKLLGIDIDNEELFKDIVILIDGNLESVKNSEVAIIDNQVAGTYRLKVGDSFQFKALVNTKEYGIVFNTIDLTVGAIIQSLDVSSSSSSTIRISNETARKFAMNDQLPYSLINIYIKDKDDTASIKQKLEESLKANNYTVKEFSKQSQIGRMGGFGPGGGGPGGPFGMRNRNQETTNSLQISSWKEETAYLEEMIQTLDRMSYLLNIVLMAIVLIGISSSLIASIRERTGEIGTIRAIGMRRHGVITMFILEGVILGFFGSVLGVIIGGTISGLFTSLGIYIGESNLSVFLIKNTLFFKLNFELIFIVFLCVMLVSIIASIQPSYKASKLSPAIVMNVE